MPLGSGTSPARAVRAAALGASVALCAATIGGCAGFDPLGPQPLAGAAQSAVSGRGNVWVHLSPEGVAIVSGWVEERLDRQAVLRTVASRSEVVGIVDRLRVDDRFR